jgi:hypothetical protein
MGSDIVPDKSVARTGAFIAASFFVPNFEFGMNMGLPTMGRSIAIFRSIRP